jgi:MipA family protein
LPEFPLTHLVHSILALVLISSQASASDEAPAQAQPDTQQTEAKPDWTIDLGAGALYLPRFSGAKRFRVMPLPFVAVRYKDVFFASQRDGIGFNAINTNGFTAGPVINVAFPRFESVDRAALGGLGDVDTTIEGGFFAQYSFAPFLSTKLEVRKGLFSFGRSQNKQLAALGISERSDGHDGIVAEWSATVSAPPLFDNRLFISTSPRASFYDQSYAQAYFGVTANQALASGYAPYKPKAGIGKVGLGLTAVYRATDDITLIAFGGYDRLVGAAARSPIVKGPDGSVNQFSIGAGVTYRFGF